jgi:hypothetical protein
MIVNARHVGSGDAKVIQIDDSDVSFWLTPRPTSPLVNLWLINDDALSGKRYILVGYTTSTLPLNGLPPTPIA